MDKLQKLFRRIREVDRDRLIAIISEIKSGKIAHLDVRKLKGKITIYRVRKGRFRILFKRRKDTGEFEITDVKYRDEGTYK